jgi:putative protease
VAREVVMEKLELGRITHYFAKPGVAALVLKGELKVGDKISIEGHTTDFEQTVESMQIEHDIVESAKAGDSVGIKVKDRVREHDVVYKIVE